MQAGWSSWNLDPFLVGSLVLAGSLYLSGGIHIRRRARQGVGVAGWRMLVFGLGLLAIFVALVSPVDALSEELFSVHMVQHLLLALVAAPLLVLAAPLAPVLAALPPGWRGRIAAPARRQPVRAAWRVATYPLAAWLLNAAILWSWHAPALYDRALDQPWVHVLEHLSLLGAGLLFWWSLLRPVGRERTPAAVAVLYVFTTGVHSSALGALLTFSTTVWYNAHQPFVAAWGLTALEDQQLAGLIMWVPGGTIYLAASLILAARVLTDREPVDSDPTRGYAIGVRQADDTVAS